LDRERIGTLRIGEPRLTHPLIFIETQKNWASREAIPKRILMARRMADRCELAEAVPRRRTTGKSAPAEPTEPRAGVEENTVERGTPRTPGQTSVSHGLDGVRQAARETQEKLTALLHHVDVDLLRLAYGWLAKDAAAGVDGVSWRGYGQDLERKLEDLHDRIHRGGYRALPSLRVYIPKPDGRQRPLGIAALEDKIVQRAPDPQVAEGWGDGRRGSATGNRRRKER
jgi:hypothetical protein